MSGAEIREDVVQALREVARDVGDGSYSIQIRRDPKKQDPWTPAIGPDGVPVSIPAMLSDWTREEKEDEGILSTDIKVLMAAGFIEPLTGDAAILSGIEYEVKNVGLVRPSGSVLYYKLHLRK